MAGRGRFGGGATDSRSSTFPQSSFSSTAFCFDRVVGAPFWMCSLGLSQTRGGGRGLRKRVRKVSRFFRSSCSPANEDALGGLERAVEYAEIELDVRGGRVRRCRGGRSGRRENRGVDLRWRPCVVCVLDSANGACCLVSTACERGGLAGEIRTERRNGRTGFARSPRLERRAAHATSSASATSNRDVSIAR